MHKQQNVQNCLVQSQWDLRKAVIILAKDPAQGGFREFQNFIITGNCRITSVAGASNSGDGLFYRNQTSIISPERESGVPSGSRDPKRGDCPGNIEFRFGCTPFPDRRDPKC